MPTITDVELINFTGSVTHDLTPEYPSNLFELQGSLGIFLGLVNYMYVPGTFMPSVTNQDYRNFANQLRFARAKKRASIQTQVNAVALRRRNGIVDIAIKVSNVFTPVYDRTIGNLDNLTRTLYQDQVGLRIRPRDTSLLNINPDGVVPKTDLNTVEYNNSATWSFSGGFSGGANVGIEDGKGSAGGSITVNGEIGYQMTASAGTQTKDFRLRKESEGRSDLISWVAEMRNKYEPDSRLPNPGGYDVNNPYSLIVNGAFTRWLYDPVETATSDLDLEYIATYSSVDSNIANKTIEFDLVATQRLMHAEVTGRWGLPDAKVGGVGVVVPYYVFSRMTLTLNLATGEAKLTPLFCRGYNARDFATINQDQVLRDVDPNAWQSIASQDHLEKVLMTGDFGSENSDANRVCNFAFKSGTDGRVLDVDLRGGTNPGNGTQVQLWNWGGGNNQKWQISFLPSQSQPGKLLVRLQSQQNGRFLDLDLRQGTPTNGTRLQQWDWNGGNNQLWYMEPLGARAADGVKLTSVMTGKCVDVDASQGTTDGSRVQQWDWNGKSDQMWYPFQA